MRGFRDKKTRSRVQLFICCLVFLFCVPFSYSEPSPEAYLPPPQVKTSEEIPEEDFKIKTQDTIPSLSEKIREESANPQIIEVFDSALFDTKKEEKPDPSSSLIWLHDPKIQEKRSKIIGSQTSTFETFWKMNLDGVLLNDTNTDIQMIQTRINAKVLTQFTDFFFASAEFELFAGSGSIQSIYRRLGEGLNGITQREVFLLLKPTDWLSLQMGILNQRFLQAPLLLGDIPFPSIVENITIFKEEGNSLSLSIQQALPTVFSDDHSISAQELAEAPLFMSGSFFWDYDPKSYYKITLNGTFFHYNPLPNDIAQASFHYGNTVEGSPNKFKYDYTGFYVGLEPAFQIFPNLGVKLKAHYIRNIRDGLPSDLNQGVLYGVHVPFDITENFRLTSIFEYFINQPDAAVAYYNSSRYGNSDRTGFVGELILNIYDRNMEVGFRYLYSDPVREFGVREKQTYYRIFLRTGYVKI
ncbi:MAG: hypothetical protein OXM55_04595 [Bdellovibrionales bacterium]|nr:hypothetical protein [Bdellovibrionales bacterium]